MTEFQIKSKIARLEPSNCGGVGYDLATTVGKNKVSGFYNKTIRFYQLNRGTLFLCQVLPPLTKINR